MRITCPECGAQYEVAADVITEMGRDVQCSACSHTWFAQAEPDVPPAPAELPSFMPPPQRPPLSPEVAAILREEAAREAAQRAMEAMAFASTRRPPAQEEDADWGLPSEEDFLGEEEVLSHPEAEVDEAALTADIAALAESFDAERGMTPAHVESYAFAATAQALESGEEDAPYWDGEEEAEVLPDAAPVVGHIGRTADPAVEAFDTAEGDEATTTPADVADLPEDDSSVGEDEVAPVWQPDPPMDEDDPESAFPDVADDLEVGKQALVDRPEDDVAEDDLPRRDAAWAGTDAGGALWADDTPVVDIPAEVDAADDIAPSDDAGDPALWMSEAVTGHVAADLPEDVLGEPEAVGGEEPLSPTIAEVGTHIASTDEVEDDDIILAPEEAAGEAWALVEDEDDTLIHGEDDGAATLIDETSGPDSSTAGTVMTGIVAPDDDLSPEDAPEKAPEDADEADGAALSAIAPPCVPQEPDDTPDAALLRAQDVRARMAALRAMPYPIEAARELAAFAPAVAVAGLPAQPDFPQDLVPQDLDAAEDLVEEIDPEEEAELREIFGELDGADAASDTPFDPLPAPDDLRDVAPPVEMPVADVPPVVAAAPLAAAFTPRSVMHETEVSLRPARALLPDIEEINSSLQPAGVIQTPPRRPSPPPPKGSSFSRGFAMVLLLSAVLCGIYIGADALAETVPALAAPLESYVAQVDALRLWLDLSVQSLLPQS